MRAMRGRRARPASHKPKHHNVLRCQFEYREGPGDEAYNPNCKAPAKMMIRAKRPCRQLNSEKIKSNALCFKSPVVSGKCSIKSAKCVCNVKEVLKKSWETICKTHDGCDKAISGKCRRKLK